MEPSAGQRTLRIIGQSTPSIEGAAKVTAEARYLEDLQAPGMLYGKICRSPLPHARIVDVDTTRAERLPGVISVVTARDLPDIKFSFVPEFADKTPLCAPGRTVRYAGDEVAAVAALDEATAEEAARLIEVSYEPLEPVLDLEAALSPDSPRVHDGGNVAYEVHKAEGDVEAAFAGCDLVLEEEFETTRQSHAVMETRGCIAHWPATGQLTVWHQTQAPHTLRGEIARALGIPQRLVRVIQPETGGGFGARLVMNVMVPIAAVLSRKSGRPVRIVNTRDEEFRCAGARYAYRFRLRLGCTQDGVIRAKSLEVLGDNGAYNDKGISTINFITMAFFSSYDRHHPATSVDARLVYTNKPPGGAFRGFGHAEETFAFESTLESMAERLGLDPVEVRLKNLRRPCERTCVERATRLLRPGKAGDEKATGGTRTGIGMAVLSETGAGLRYYRQNSTEAIVKVGRDGSVDIIATIADTGTGTRTVMAQIAAEQLGVSVERIRLFHNDTDVTPYDLGTWASRTTYVCGNAVAAAAADARRRLAEVAAGMLGAAPETLAFGGERVAATVEPGGELEFDEVVREAYDRQGLLIIGKGAFVDEGGHPLRSQRLRGGGPGHRRLLPRGRGAGGHGDRRGGAPALPGGARRGQGHQPHGTPGPDRGRRHPGAGFRTLRGPVDGRRPGAEPEYGGLPSPHLRHHAQEPRFRARGGRSLGGALRRQGHRRAAVRPGRPRHCQRHLQRRGGAPEDPPHDAGADMAGVEEVNRFRT